MKTTKNDLATILKSRGEQIVSSRTPATKDILGTEKHLTLENSKPLLVANFQINPKLRNRLILPTGPLLAIELSYRYDLIDWVPGANHDHIYVPSPNGFNPIRDPHFHDPTRSAWAILWEYAGIVSQTGTFEGGGRGAYITEVYVTVNDDYFVDNTGVISVDLLSYSQV